MNSNDFLQIKYDAFIHNDGVEDFQDVEVFKEEIKKNYHSFVKANGVGRGGAYELVMHFISDLSWSDYLKFVSLYVTTKFVDQVTDLLIQKYLLIPIQDAYKKLKKKNPILDCHSFQLEFKDISIFIYKTSENSLIPNLMKIIEAIDNHSNNIKAIEFNDGVSFKPTEIHIPVVLDRVEGEKVYRIPMGIEETTNLDDKDYFKYWGIKYFHNQLNIIYDVENKLAIKESSFYTEEEFKSVFNLYC
ncbi:MAG: hypothetical protein ACRCXZ_04305 [Patescibacteria group bacterium]